LKGAYRRALSRSAPDAGDGQNAYAPNGALVAGRSSEVIRRIFMASSHR
jgi:hypothetical protein